MFKVLSYCLLLITACSLEPTNEINDNKILENKKVNVSIETDNKSLIDKESVIKSTTLQAQNETFLAGLRKSWTWARTGGTPPSRWPRPAEAPATALALAPPRAPGVRRARSRRAARHRRPAAPPCPS